MTIKRKPASKKTKPKPIKDIKLKSKVNNEEMLFQKKLKDIRKIMQDETLSEQSSIALTKALLGSLLEAIHIAENTYRKNPISHNGYALNSLMTQAQTFTKELRLMQTQQEELQKIIQTAVFSGLERFVFQSSQQLIKINTAIDSTGIKIATKKQLKTKVADAADGIADFAQIVVDMIIDEIIKKS